MLSRLRSCLFCKVLAFLWVFLAATDPQLYAYTDDLEADSEEVWNAIQEVLKPYGIYKIWPEKKQIESDWIEDRVRRTRRLLPIGPKKTFTQIYRRRYRIRIQLKQYSPGTEVRVKGRFQLKPLQDTPQLHWQPVLKTQLVDDAVERDFFFKILKKIEERRRGIS